MPVREKSGDRARIRARSVHIEQRLEIVPVEAETSMEPEQAELLSLTDQLAQPELSLELRLLLVAQMQAILRRKTRAALMGEVPIPVAITPLAIYCESANEGS